MFNIYSFTYIACNDIIVGGWGKRHLNKETFVIEHYTMEDKMSQKYADKKAINRTI